MPDRDVFDLVIAANRLPVDAVRDDEGTLRWRRSPGGLVTAMESVMTGREGAWVGWSGEAGEAPEPFEERGLHLHPVPLDQTDVVDYYEGQSNDCIWPIYHDAIVPATFRRRWTAAYRRVNARFAEHIDRVAAPGATIWVHDYQLQQVPAMLRSTRPDVRIGWFNHIPVPPVELFMQLPSRVEILEGLLGADFLGFQRKPDAANFLRACRWLLDVRVRGEVVHLPGGRSVRACAVPISVDYDGLQEIALSDAVQQRARELREQLGDPKHILLGVDRLDYTKGLRHRLKAYGELLHDGRLDPRETVFVQVATPSRERLAAYRQLRGQVEGSVGRINGEYSPIGSTALTYLHRSFPREEMTALFAAADIMVVTPLRDGMNLVAKEYVTCHGDDGALVLSEFTGAADELHRAYLCNPHDIEALKATILRAIHDPAADRRRRMRTMRRRVASHDVQRWAQAFLDHLSAAPGKPGGAQ